MLVRTEAYLFRLRLEKAVADLKPPPNNIDPITNLWTVYKKVADEHDDDLVSKYAGDLDTSLLFVSVSTSLACLVLIDRVFFRVRRVYSRPSLLHSSSRSFHSSSRIPSI